MMTQGRFHMGSLVYKCVDESETRETEEEFVHVTFRAAVAFLPGESRCVVQLVIEATRSENSHVIPEASVLVLSTLHSGVVDQLKVNPLTVSNAHYPHEVRGDWFCDKHRIRRLVVRLLSHVINISGGVHSSP